MKWHADPVFAGDDRFGSKLPVDLEIGIVPACRIQNWDFTCSAPVRNRRSLCRLDRKTLSRVRVKGFRDGYFDASQETAVIRDIRDSGAAILLVAFGSPRQDL